MLQALSFNLATVYRCLRILDHITIMQSKKFTRAVVWLVVIAMVLSLIVVAAASIF